MRRLEKLARLQRKLGWKEDIHLTGVDLDENIYPLLLLMNLAGNQTFSSCGGHEDGKLRCWSKDDPDEIKWGGYIDFKPQSEDLFRFLRDWLKYHYIFHDQLDVWFNSKPGVGLLRDPKYPNVRLSWYFKRWKASCRFIELLETFFIERVGVK